MTTIKKTKSHSVTCEQKKVMVDFLNSHKELMRGKFTQNFTHSVAAKQWAELRELLNMMIGPTKDWKAWRRVRLINILVLLKLNRLLIHTLTTMGSV